MRKEIVLNPGTRRSVVGPTAEDFGAFVRSQRELARLSLRQAAELARISNPYLSQIEHGLALPSVTVLSNLAEALSVSVETLARQAAGSDQPSSEASRVEAAIREDARLSAEQKRALLTIVESFTQASETSKPKTRTKTARTRTP